MAETISKLQPDRTLELGFFNYPASNAALHSTSSNGWILSGKFRTQHDYAIVEWNKHNRWDHPRLRYLPDGDLSGLVLSYDEQRTDCQPIESGAYAFTDWPELLIWATPPAGTEQLYRVPIKDHATIVSGVLLAASASFTIGGTVTTNDAVSVTIMTEKYAYVVSGSDTLESIAAGIAAAINSGGASRLCDASSSGTTVTLTARTPGRDGNAIAFQVTLYHLATKAHGSQNYSGAIQEPNSNATGSIGGSNYSATGWPWQTLTDLVYALAVQEQSNSQVDAAWAGASINLTAKTAGSAGNGIALTAGGTNGVTGGVTPMSGGTDNGYTALLTATPETGLLSGGSSAVTWRITLDFATLVDKFGAAVPTANIRRLRWVYSPALQLPAGFNGSAAFAPCEFEVQVTNWTVTGTGAALQVAGPLSQRIEDDDARATYHGAWGVQQGNVSSESIHYTTHSGDWVETVYSHPFAHGLYLGTQRTFDSAIVEIQIDGGTPFNLDLYTPGVYPNDILLARERLAAELAAGEHTVRISHTGTKHPDSTGFFFYLDFLEAVVLADPPDAPEVRTGIGLATDYDTAALWLSPERLAWSIDKLGLKGEVNHFAGVEFFYEKLATGWSAGSATVTVSDTIQPGDWLTITIGGSPIVHAVAYGDTPATVAAVFAAAINVLTSVWADSAGDTITIHARVPGLAGNSIALSVSAKQTASAATLLGGIDGTWQTDGAASPILNRAARDWHRGFAAALSARGIAVTMALSMEVKHAPLYWGQEFNDGSTVITGNGTVQTSPSIPAAKTFWKECYKALAAEMVAAGVTPRLQFGETQWWYTAGGSPASMAYYDAQTTADFLAQYGRALHVFTAPGEDPSINAYQDTDFLRDRLGAFCDAVRTHVLAAYPGAVFEVLWPRDVNAPDLNPLNYYVNLPVPNWAPGNIAKFKTEAFQESMPQRDMNKARVTVRFPMICLAFAAGASRHLLGVMASYPWLHQIHVAESEGIDLVTLWAWDQFCAIGRKLPITRAPTTAQYIGN